MDVGPIVSYPAEGIVVFGSVALNAKAIVRVRTYRDRQHEFRFEAKGQTWQRGRTL